MCIRDRDICGGLTAVRHGGSKTRKRTNRTRRRFHEKEVFRISPRNPLPNFSHREQNEQKANLGSLDRRLRRTCTTWQHLWAPGRSFRMVPPRVDSLRYAQHFGFVLAYTRRVFACDRTLEFVRDTLLCTRVPGTRYRAHRSPLSLPHPFAPTVFSYDVVVRSSTCLEKNVSQ